MLVARSCDQKKACRPRRSSVFGRISSYVTWNSSVSRAGSSAASGCCCPIGLKEASHRERPSCPDVKPHPLELQLGLPAAQILDVISGAFRLAAAVRGGVAEHHLERHLRQVLGVRHVRHIIEDGKPDFEVEYRKKPFLIECKNVLARTQQGLPKVDFQKTRASKADPCSRYYKPTQFHVLAACLHPITQQWEFRFAPTAALAQHKKCRDGSHPSVGAAGVAE